MTRKAAMLEDYPRIQLLLIACIPLFILFGTHLLRRREAPAPRSEEWWAERRAQIRKEEMTEKFHRYFGFSPELLPQDRYKKEIFLKLSLYANDLKRKSADAASYGGPFQDSYNSLSKKYIDALETIGYFDSRFQAEIPHWTELMSYVDAWARRKKSVSPRENVRVTVE